MSKNNKNALQKALKISIIIGKNPVSIVQK